MARDCEQEMLPMMKRLRQRNLEDVQVPVLVQALYVDERGFSLVSKRS